MTGSLRDRAKYGPARHSLGEGGSIINEQIMQNKANLLKTNVTIVCTEDYENKYNWTLGENKPNLCHRYQTQSVVSLPALSIVEVPALTCGELVEPSRTACRQSKFPRRSYNRLLPRICRNRRIKLTKTH
ncbi:MAG: hypothetical protein ACYSTN_08625 [Planctomycetota bacterium]